MPFSMDYVDIELNLPNITALILTTLLVHIVKLRKTKCNYS